MKTMEKIELESVRLAKEMAESADAETVEGMAKLRMALRALVSANRSLLKTEEIMLLKEQLLPRFDVLANHEGINFDTKCAVKRIGSQIKKSRFNSSFLLDQLYEAFQLERVWFYRASETDPMLIRASVWISRQGADQADEKTERYIEKNSRRSNPGSICTLNMTFTMPALKWFVTTTAEQYLNTNM